jgi:peptidylprolyl isomerase
MEVVKAITPGDHMISVRIVRVGPAVASLKVTQQSFDALVEKAKTGREDRKKLERSDALTQIAKKWPRLSATKSGLMFEVLKRGSGGSPSPTSHVSVNYTGALLDGRIFASTSASGQPAIFQVNRVIPGWMEALLAMKRGEKRRLVIPPELAYGEHGYPGLIPPNSFLLFEVELIDF